MPDDKKKRKKYKYIDPSSEEYYKLAANCALSWVIIDQCHKCWHPVVNGYCCSHCGDAMPSMTWEQEDEYERKLEKKMKRFRP